MTTEGTHTLFQHANVFDGVQDALFQDVDVLVTDNRIVKVGSSISIDALQDVKVIDCAGKTLMPGMIDAHTHLAINALFGDIENNMTLEDVSIRSVVAARHWLMDGFTTVRDVGGPVFGLKRAVDEGLVPGPRIYPSGAFLTQTSGHGDFRSANDTNCCLFPGRVDCNFEKMGFNITCDGRDRVLAATRQNLMRGATQIKIMAGGGGASKYDPIDTAQFLPEEMEAAVQAADDWGTYVCAHIFTPKAISRAIKAGVKSLEHGFFMDEATVKLCAENGVFVVPQMTGVSPELLRNPMLPPNKIEVVRKAQADAAEFHTMLLKYKVKVAYASDAVGPLEDIAKQRRFEMYARGQKFPIIEVLRQATSVAGELVALCGKRNPYDGRLGVIEEGALADILVVNGNPLKDLAVLGAEDKWFDLELPKGKEGPDSIQLIMKDGKVYKNTL